MNINFSFNSFDNSTQNNSVDINNNDIDKILDLLKEANVPDADIKDLKLAIANDEEETQRTNSLGLNVRTWCLSLFNKITTGVILNATIPIVTTKLKNVLATIYQFPIQF